MRYNPSFRKIAQIFSESKGQSSVHFPSPCTLTGDHILQFGEWLQKKHPNTQRGSWMLHLESALAVMQSTELATTALLDEEETEGKGLDR